MHTSLIHSPLNRHSTGKLEQKNKQLDQLTQKFQNDAAVTLADGGYVVRDMMKRKHYPATIQANKEKPYTAFVENDTQKVVGPIKARVQNVCGLYHKEELSGSKNSQLHILLKQKNIDMEQVQDQELFLTCFAIQYIIDSVYPKNAIDIEQRKSQLSKNEIVSASQLLRSNSRACMEYSMVAQLLIEQVLGPKGYKTTFIAGDMSGGGFGEKHAYLQISKGSDKFLYCPTNPCVHNATEYPYLSHIQSDLGSATNQMIQISTIEGIGQTSDCRSYGIAA